ncbi:MAG TPA: SAM-dependent methyltransferase, partial [Anaerolineales bacterium]|nr:SAM-dependent methyltransferase [Anaerolineales bacterium]
DIDWASISHTGTVIFLMGVEHLPEIVTGLLTFGRQVDTPVALVQEGTTQNQLVVTGTLENIVEKAQSVRPPAVFVVGEVVRLREQIDWFIPRPFGTALKNIPDEIFLPNATGAIRS